MTRALVLGGGGLTGIAWETGVLMGLSDGGVDIRHWDLVVGTSAGSVVGAKVLGEPDFATFFRQQVLDHAPEDDLPIRAMKGPFAATVLRLGRRRGLGWLPSTYVMALALETVVRQRVRRRATTTMATRREAIRCFTEPDPGLARVGSFARAARTASHDVYRKVMAQTLDPVADWPGPLVVTAIDAETGETVALDRACGVPFLDAVAASCAVPGFMAPVTIGGRRYMDGGMASQTHADLARGCDEVVIVAPLDLGRLGGEIERLRASGTRVTVVSPSAEARVAIGRHVALLDPARRARAARAGLLDGRRAAEAGAVAQTHPERRAARLAGSES